MHPDSMAVRVKLKTLMSLYYNRSTRASAAPASLQNYSNEMEKDFFKRFNFNQT